MFGNGEDKMVTRADSMSIDVIEEGCFWPGDRGWDFGFERLDKCLTKQDKDQSECKSKLS